jgi:NAD(P)-dependent dehydrogenase (short-subunit alcohol dehydrogenase family)
LDAAFANAGLDAGAGFWNPATHSRNPQGQIDTFDHATWRKSMSVNLDGVFFTVAEAARVMKSGGRPGSIIVTSSIASSKVFPPIATPYMAAKAAVTQLVKQVALELAEYRIRVNAIAPGMFVTNIGGGYLQNPAVREAWGKIVPLGKMAEPEQIKPLALFLASDASDFVTGTEMVIDGGVLLGNFG